MFVSGVTCALAYGNVQRTDGWPAVISHTIRRSWEIYASFLTLTVALPTRPTRGFCWSIPGLGS